MDYHQGRGLFVDSTVDDQLGTGSHDAAVFSLEAGDDKIGWFKLAELRATALDNYLIADTHAHIAAMGTGEASDKNISPYILEFFIESLVYHLFLAIPHVHIKLFNEICTQYLLKLSLPPGWPDQVLPVFPAEVRHFHPSRGIDNILLAWASTLR